MPVCAVCRARGREAEHDRARTVPAGHGLLAPVGQELKHALLLHMHQAIETCRLIPVDSFATPSPTPWAGLHAMPPVPVGFLLTLNCAVDGSPALAKLSADDILILGPNAGIGTRQSLLYTRCAHASALTTTSESDKHFRGDPRIARFGTAMAECEA